MNAGPFDKAWRYAKSTFRSGNIALHGGLAAILVVGVVAFDAIGDSLWQNRNKGVSCTAIADAGRCWQSLQAP